FAALAAIATLSMIRDLAWPYKTTSDQRARAFAEWFWFNAEFGGEAVCIHSDLGKVFSPETYENINWSAQFECNMHIYSRRHAAHQPVHWDQISADHPLRCVLYRAAYHKVDESALQAWLAEMQQNYLLASRELFPLVRQDKRELYVVSVDYLEIYKFVPKSPASIVSKPANESASLRLVPPLPRTPPIDSAV